jgi:hypothetical protein
VLQQGEGKKKEFFTPESNVPLYPHAAPPAVAEKFLTHSKNPRLGPLPSRKNAYLSIHDTFG